MAKRKPSGRSGKKTERKTPDINALGGTTDPNEIISKLLSHGASPSEVIRALEELNSLKAADAFGALNLSLAESQMTPFLDDGFDDFEELEDVPRAQITREEAAEECAAIDKQLKRKPNDVDLLSARARYSLTAEESLAFQQRAFDSATKKLGKIERFAGRFWVDWKTRPYMTARLDLSRSLWENGRNNEAIEHLEALMELDPDDHLGARFRALKLWLDVGRWEDAEKLIAERSEEEFADVLFTAVLLEFRRNGDSENAKSLLRRAMRQNRYAVKELLGEGTPSVELDAAMAKLGETEMTIGGISEAIDHANGYRATWRTVPGAISWLRTAAHQIEAELKAAEPAPHIKPEEMQATTKDVREALRAIKTLPFEEDERWLVDVIPNASPGKWGLVVLDASEMQILTSVELEFEPTPATVTAFVCDLMNDPVEGDYAFRPVQIVLIREELFEPLSKWFESARISVEMAENAEEMRQMSDRAFSRGEVPDTPLTDVPQYEEVWEVDWRRADTWVQAESGELVQPWLMLVADRDTEAIIQNAMELSEFSEETVIRHLRRAVLLPQMGDPHRPTQIVVKSGDSKVALSNWLTEAEVDCVIDEFELLDDIYDKMKDDLFPEMQPALVETEGASSDLIGELYEASAKYFKAAPWRSLRPRDIITLTCPQLSHRTYYAAGMGQNGESLGFMLFEDPKLLDIAFSSSKDNSDFGGLSLTLEDKHHIAPADIAAAEQFGWPVVSDESWPLLVNMSMAEGMTEVSADEIRITIVAVHVLLEFWKSPEEARRRDDTKLEFPVQLEGRTVVAAAKIFHL